MARGVEELPAVRGGWRPLHLVTEAETVVDQSDPGRVDSPHRGIRQFSRQDRVGLLQEDEPGIVNLPRPHPLVAIELATDAAKLDASNFVPVLAVELDRTRDGRICEHRLRMACRRIRHDMETQLLVDGI